jgi:hypothetical protein
MAEFVKGSKLNSEIESVFEDAEECIIVISPYIKLHSRFIEILKGKKDNPNIEITIVFGKNEDDISKSINEEDVKFLAEFPNISIKHEPRLHAKYYSNETTSVLSSMNLYDFSQNNNIEFGIVTKATFLSSIAGNIGSTVDKDAFEYFNSVIENSNCIYKRIPVFENKLLGLSKKYVKSEVEIDSLSDLFKSTSNQATKTVKHAKNKHEKMGFCIRTGENEEYPEKFCHYSGEESNGETSLSKPILKKNWRKSQN